VISAQVISRNGFTAFLDDGWLPFERSARGACKVQCKRVGRYLLVEDNGGCGGAGVSFTWLYHRK